MACPWSLSSGGRRVEAEPADVAVGGRLDAADDLFVFFRLEQVRVPGLDAQVVGHRHLAPDRGGAGHLATDMAANSDSTLRNPAARSSFFTIADSASTM